MKTLVLALVGPFLLASLVWSPVFRGLPTSSKSRPEVKVPRRLRLYVHFSKLGAPPAATSPSPR